MKLTVYGASDDLIEIDGDIREEFNHTDADEFPYYLAFSDGTLASIQYVGGFWRIHVLSTGSCPGLRLVQATDEEKDYSDRLSLEGDFKWVVCGRDCERAR